MAFLLAKVGITYNQSMTKHLLLVAILFSLLTLVSGCGGVVNVPTKAPFTQFQSPDGLLTLSIPDGWIQSETKSANGKLNEYKFTAPDKRGFIHIVVGMGDQPIPNPTAQQFALRILQSYIEKTDKINVLSDETTGEHQHTIKWHAVKDLVGGTAIVENAGTNLIVIVASNLDAAKADYQPLYDQVLASYKTK